MTVTDNCAEAVKFLLKFCCGTMHPFLEWLSIGIKKNGHLNIVLIFSKPPLIWISVPRILLVALTAYSVPANDSTFSQRDIVSPCGTPFIWKYEIWQTSWTFWEDLGLFRKLHPFTEQGTPMDSRTSKDALAVWSARTCAAVPWTFQLRHSKRSVSLLRL